MAEFVEEPLIQLIMILATLLSGGVALIQLAIWILEYAKRNGIVRAASMHAEILRTVVYFIGGMVSVSIPYGFGLFVALSLVVMPITSLFEGLEYSELANYVIWLVCVLALGAASGLRVVLEMKIANRRKMRKANRSFSWGIAGLLLSFSIFYFQDYIFAQAGSEGFWFTAVFVAIHMAPTVPFFFYVENFWRSLGEEDWLKT